MKKQLKDEIPILGDWRSTDFQKVTTLRDWAYRHVPRTNTETLALEGQHGYQVYQEALPTLISRFTRLEGGFFCGGTAVTLAKLYRLFGYEAYTYNMGNPDGNPSHVVTLVRIHDGMKSLLSIQDAYFNYTLVQNGHPLGFRQLLSSLGRRNISSIQYLSGDVHCKPLLVDADHILAARAGLTELGIRFGPVLASRNGRSCFCHDLQLSAYRSEFERWLDGKVPQRDFLDIFLFPLGADGGADAPQLSLLASATRRSLWQGQTTVN